MTTAIQPIDKTIVVPLTVDEAFRLFTERIAKWWPLSSHSVAEERARSAVFEAGVGGRIYEIADDGTEAVWGHVTVWEPPNRVVFTFHPGRGADTAGVVEVTFSAQRDSRRTKPGGAAGGTAGESAPDPSVSAVADELGGAAGQSGAAGESGLSGAETVVRLVHSGWEKFGDRAIEMRGNYDTGWDYVFGECYGGASRG